MSPARNHSASSFTSRASIVFYYSFGCGRENRTPSQLAYETSVTPCEAAIVLVLVRTGYIQNTLGIQSHQALYLDCSLSPPLASDLYPALQVVALTRRYCCVMVDPEGIEPSTPTCKTGVFPLAPRAHYIVFSWHTHKDLNPDH